MTESKEELRTFSELSDKEKKRLVAVLALTLARSNRLNLEEMMELTDFLCRVFINRSFDETGALQE